MDGSYTDPSALQTGRHSTRWTNSSCKSGNCNSNVSERSNCSSNICSRSGHHPGADRFLSLMLKIATGQLSTASPVCAHAPQTEVYDVLVVTPHREDAPAVLNLLNCSASLRALAVQGMASSYKARSHLPEPSERSFPSGSARAACRVGLGTAGTLVHQFVSFIQSFDFLADLRTFLAPSCLQRSLPF